MAGAASCLQDMSCPSWNAPNAPVINTLASDSSPIPLPVGDMAFLHDWPSEISRSMEWSARFLNHPFSETSDLPFTTNAFSQQ